MKTSTSPSFPLKNKGRHWSKGIFENAKVKIDFNMMCNDTIPK